MSHIATIEIELLSETVFGGDGDQIGTVDLDVQVDEHGLPYYAGRTLKGVLREQAEWYVECLTKSPQRKKMEQAIQRLFGIPDSSDRSVHHSNHTSLRFADAKLSDGIYDFVKKEDLDTQHMLQAITTVRMMTSIDNESGTAKDGSLRQVRVIHPGYTFYAPVYIQGILSQKEKSLLETSVKLVRHIGVMRHRGKGSVRCTLHWNEKLPERRDNIHNMPEKANTEITEIIKNGIGYVILDIDVHEPLKISHVLGTSDSSHALKYIPGYVLRGALVNMYLQSTGLPSGELDTSVIFDHSKIQFWNGYLMINRERSLPFVQHMFESKDQSKKKMEQRIMYNSLDKADKRKISNESPVRLVRDAMLLQPDYKLIGKNVRTTSALHINVNGNRTVKNKTESGKTMIYRYEAIAPQQSFKAVVAVKTDHPFVVWLCQQKELTLWLGGARNSGYGRVTVRPVVSSSHPEQQFDRFSSHNQAGELKELYVVATSDWIIRNRHGQLTSALDAQWLGDRLGVELHLKNQVVNTHISGGYVSPWKAYQPMISAVRAGSVYRYTIKTGTLDLDKVKLLTEQGVGARRNEGFGRLMIIPDWPYSMLREAPKEQKDIFTGYRSSTKDRQQLVGLRTALVSEKMIEQVRTQVADWYRSIEESETVTNSQWGKLLQITSELTSRPDVEQTSERHKERWDKFWKGAEARLAKKSNLGFDGIWVGGKKLKDFTIDLTAHQWQVSDMNVSLNHAKWNMRALELLIRQVLRSKSEHTEGATTI